MVDITKLAPGDKVYYLQVGKLPEKGVVKTLPTNPRTEGVWVVYLGNNDWENYASYTGALTSTHDLYYGWPETT